MTLKTQQQLIDELDILLRKLKASCILHVPTIGTRVLYLDEEDKLLLLERAKIELSAQEELRKLIAKAKANSEMFEYRQYYASENKRIPEYVG